MEKYIIGLDSGTSGIKAVLFDIQGNEIYKKGFALTAIHPHENWFEEDVYEIWEKAQLCIKDITSRYDPESISGIGITAQGDGLWMIDEEGDPVRNGCCFCDGRAAKDLDRWNQEGVTQKVFDIAGTRMFTGNQGCILKWMDRKENETLSKASYIMHLKDVLFCLLTGEKTTDATDQSLVFIDLDTHKYSQELFDLYGLSKYRDKYPPIMSALENKAIIKPELAKSLNLSQNTLITSGPMDVAACALGAGVTEDGHCCTIMGTAALHEMVISKPNNDNIFAGMTVTHVAQKRWLRLMASMAGTPNLDWAIDTLAYEWKIKAEQEGVDIYTYIEGQIRDIPIGSHGVIYHPYLLAGGERAPFVDFNAKANFSGITSVTSLGDLLRACYEGVAFAMLDCYSHMPQNVERITMCGGGAKSGFWCQMFADVVGKPVVTVEGGELGARGAAMTNGVAQGAFSSFDEAVKSIVKVKNIYYPSNENHKKYMQYYQLYKRTYELMAETWKMRQEILFQDNE